MHSASAHKISVYFRYDDYAATTPFDLEKKVVNAFHMNNSSFTVGIIPHVTKGNYRDPHAKGHVEFSTEKIDFARQALAENIMDPALHGFEHKTAYERNPHSEFRGLPQDIQLSKLSKGATLFEQQFGLWPRAFIPPWNTYDDITVKALECLNINSLSANRFGPASAAKVFFLPITIEHHQLQEALESARNLKWADITIGVLLHPYDFHESGDSRSSLDTRELQNLLKEIKASEDTNVLSLSQIRQKRFALDFRRYKANRPSALEYVSPPYIKKTYTYPLYLPTKAATYKQFGRMMHTLFFFLAVMALAAFGGITARNYLTETAAVEWTYTLGFISLGAAIALGIHTFIRKHVYFKAAIAYAAVTGLIISLFFL